MIATFDFDGTNAPRNRLQRYSEPPNIVDFAAGLAERTAEHFDHGMMPLEYGRTAKQHICRELLRRILEDTEHHIDFLETQLGLIKLMGEANYIQSAMKEIEGEG